MHFAAPSCVGPLPTLSNIHTAEEEEAMGLDLDDVVAFLRVTLFLPTLHVIILGVALLGGEWLKVQSSFQIRILVLLSSLVLFSHAISFAGRKHRNGWTRTRVLGAEEWKKEVVLITGGAGGVGSELSALLCQRGARVVVLDVVSESVFKRRGRTTYFQCDVSDADQVKSIAARIKDEVGHVSMLVNNAGVLNGKLLTDLEDSEIQRIVGVNLISHFYTIKAFLPDMVTVSSVMGHIGIAQVGDYVATKHALVGLHESLRYELDKKHKAPKVRTTLICPGHIKTALFAQVEVPALARFLAPLLDPRDVAMAILRALERQESTDIYLPWYAQWAPALRMLPSFLRDLAQTVSGADEAIEGMYKRRAELERGKSEQ
ncbi:unnamed protein product [Tilletia caries]|nr:unnamed protein product [Tilletia caries]